MFPLCSSHVFRPLQGHHQGGYTKAGNYSEFYRKISYIYIYDDFVEVETSTKNVNKKVFYY
jgi:hypothetical protein